MAVTINTKNKKGPIIDPALCRCCRSIKKCRILSAEYEWMGNKEVYSDMLMDCFGLLVSYFITFSHHQPAIFSFFLPVCTHISCHIIHSNTYLSHIPYFIGFLYL